MIDLQKEGLIKSIGVCNFQINHLQRLMDETGVPPVINQIELHPLMQQRQLHAWNATHKIQTESWSPLAQGGKDVFDQKIIRDLAEKYGKSPAQIVIRWHLDSGLVVIPKSVTPARIVENFNVWDFRLDKDELGEIAKLDQGKRLGPIQTSSAVNPFLPARHSRQAFSDLKYRETIHTHILMYFLQSLEQHYAT